MNSPRIGLILPAAVGCIVGVWSALMLYQSVFAAGPVKESQTPVVQKSPTPTVTSSPTPTDTPSPTETPQPTRKPEPTKTPKPTPRPISAADLDRWFQTYANAHSVDIQKLRQIAICESKLNPNAQNGFYAGLFQYSSASWKSIRRLMNKNSDPSLRFDPEAAIDTAAFTIATRGLNAWPSCSR